MHQPFGHPVIPHLPVVRSMSMAQLFGPAAAAHPNIIQPINLIPNTMAIADAWEKHFDKKQKKDYWHHTKTKEVRHGVEHPRSRCLICRQRMVTY